jgi:hypothetical protein
MPTVNVSGSAATNQRVFYQVDGGAENLYILDNNLGDESRIFEITSPTAVFRNVAVEAGYGWCIYNLAASIVVEGCYLSAPGGIVPLYSRLGSPLDPTRITGNTMIGGNDGMILDCVISGTAPINVRATVTDNYITGVTALTIQSTTRPLFGAQILGNVFVDPTNR